MHPHEYKGESSPVKFFDPAYIHESGENNSEAGQFDTDIMRSAKNRANQPELGYRLACYVTDAECLANLPNGHVFAPNNRPEWYVQEGSLFVVDYKQLFVGNSLSRHDLAFEPFSQDLYGENPRRLLNARLDFDISRGLPSDMHVKIPLDLGGNNAGQQIFALRTVAAGVLARRGEKFSASVLSFQKNKDGSFSTRLSRRPMFKDCFLPAEIGQVHEVMVSKGYYTIVTQCLMGVSIVDVPAGTSPRNTKGKTQKILGDFALRPRLGNV